MFLICSFLTIGSNKSNENMISDSYDFESRQTVEEYLLDIEDLIETCPFLVKTPINSRRNAVCSRNEMDSIVLLEAIADYQREAQANSRKLGNINQTCEISSRRKNISSSTEHLFENIKKKVILHSKVVFSNLINLGREDRN